MSTSKACIEPDVVPVALYPETEFSVNNFRKVFRVSLPLVDVVEELLPLDELELSDEEPLTLDELEPVDEEPLPLDELELLDVELFPLDELELSTLSRSDSESVLALVDDEIPLLLA